MENQFESLKIRYSKDTRKIYSVRVNFTDEEEDSILITHNFFSELYEYIDVSEADRELFFILAKAIQLSKENNRGRTNDNRVKKYEFSSYHESFAKKFVTKLMLVAKYIPMDRIAEYFNEDAKVEDLDIFLNQKDVYQLTLLLREGIDTTDENSDNSESEEFF